MFLQVDALTKAYGPEPVLQAVSFGVAAHETLSVLGPSGCGKTTLLKIIAGLEVPDAGRVVLDGRDLTGVSPQHRGVVYLYQEPLLFPHLDVFENIAFGLRLRRAAAAVVEAKVDEMLTHLELSSHARKRPEQLSGGQRQRVAFGRALIISPALLLLDEPFASLDAETRAAMQDLFKAMASRYQITSLFVTHDLKEALLMGDRLGSLRRGVMRTYPSQADFIVDPEAGVQREIDFWATLSDKKSTPSEIRQDD